MKKGILAGCMTAALVCAFALPSIYAVDAPADGIQMDYFKAEKNNLVTTFNHSSHKDVACEECHHMAGDQQYASCASEGCHNVMDKKDKTAASYYKIIHDRKAAMSTCVGCHADLDVVKADKDKKKMLTGCKGSACHP